MVRFETSTELSCSRLSKYKEWNEEKMATTVQWKERVLGM